MHRGREALLLGTSYSLTAVQVARETANNYLIRVPIAGKQAVAEYRLQKQTTPLAGWGAASNCWHLLGLVVHEVATQHSYTLIAQNSAWEYAGRVGLASDAASGYVFFGSIHQCQVSTGLTMALDGVDLTGLGVGQSRLGSSFVVTQTMNTILPSDKTTVIGSSALTHTFTVANHCDVAYTLNWNGAPACKYHTMYTAMLPFTSETNGLDTYKCGANSPTARVYDDGEKQKNTQHSTAIASASAAHGYVATLFLPDGGPDTSADWSHTATYKMWFHDRTDVDKGKVYVNYVDTNPATAITCIDGTQHHTRYTVT